MLGGALCMTVYFVAFAISCLNEILLYSESREGWLLAWLVCSLWEFPSRSTWDCASPGEGKGVRCRATDKPKEGVLSLVQSDSDSSMITSLIFFFWALYKSGWRANAWGALTQIEVRRGELRDLLGELQDGSSPGVDGVSLGELKELGCNSDAKLQISSKK